jgi:hypothetical protein
MTKLLSSDGFDTEDIAAVSRWLTVSETTGVRPESDASQGHASKRSKSSLQHPLQLRIPLEAVCFMLVSGGVAALNLPPMDLITPASIKTTAGPK